MMKKIYISPEVEVMKIQSQGQMLIALCIKCLPHSLKI